MHESEASPTFDATLLSRVEDAGLNASAPTQELWLDGWLVRFSPGKAKRARCVNALAVGRTSIDARLAACAQVFTNANLPMIVRITPFTLPTDLDLALAQRGWQRFEDTRVMVRCDIPTIRASAGPEIEIRAVGLEAFAQRVGMFRGSVLAQRQAHAQRLVNTPLAFHAFELRVQGQPAACGQFAVEGDLVGLYDVFTAESMRGRGLATMLCRHLLIQARALGARHAYLQVEGDNEPARVVYRRMGFADAYAYHYRTPGASAA